MFVVPLRPKDARPLAQLGFSQHWRLRRHRPPVASQPVVSRVRATRVRRQDLPPAA